MPTKSLLDNQAIKVQLDTFLAEFLDRKISTGHDFGQPYQTLVKRMRQFTLRGGKRLRPYLCYLGYAAAGGKGELPLEVMAAVELFHNSLLIHDDIMDRDLSRYGGPNVTGLYLDDFTKDALHLATSAALLAGDLNIAFVQELILNCRLELADKQTVLTSLASQYQKVIAGQLLDSLPQSSSPITAADIVQIQLCKTASYSTTGPLLLGAQIAHGSQSLLDRLHAYGENLGLLFQTTDDLLGMFGEEGATGKPNCTDLHENKPTMLFLYARQLATGADLESFLHLLGSPHQPKEDMGELRNILIKSGAKARTEELAQKYASQAIDSIANLSGSAADELRLLPEQLVHRVR